MDTYDEIYLKCSSMYINIRMSKSNITDSPDGNQLNVIDSSYEINKLVHFTIHSYSCGVHLGHGIHRPSDTHAAMICHACAVLDRSLACACRSRDMSHARTPPM